RLREAGHHLGSRCQQGQSARGGEARWKTAASAASFQKGAGRSMNFDRETQLRLIDEANRAPSIHNVQPALWRFGYGEVELYGNNSRWLAVSDPTGHDDRVSLGAALEGMAIALSRLGIGLEGVEILKTPPSQDGGRRLV